MATSNFKITKFPRIGIVGGGQLAKMIALPALELGCEIVILEKSHHTPAAALATKILYGDWDKHDNLLQLAEKVDVITLENEFVNADSLKKLEDNNHRLFPSAKTIAQVQDKLIQKQTLTEAGIPVAPFAAVNSKQAIIDYADKFNWPLVLKARRYGYDGKGNATLNSAADIDHAWDKLNGTEQELYVEAFCPFTLELAVMVTRGTDGEMIHYPVVESVQQNHICHLVRAPANIDKSLAEKAIKLARDAVIAIDGIGTIGVEFFLTKDQQIILNEMAPRVHNSGHYTIEACECSQFENHVRAILGLPLGSPKMVAPAAVMINIIGGNSLGTTSSGYPNGLAQALAVKGAHVHIYGKDYASLGRKMGHVTALGNTIEEAELIAGQAANHIDFKAKIEV